MILIMVISLSSVKSKPSAIFSRRSTLTYFSYVHFCRVNIYLISIISPYRNGNQALDFIEKGKFFNLSEI